MFKWLKKLIKSIYSPKEFSDSIHKKNRRAMKQGFWFSTAFGSVVLLASLILTKGHLTGLQIFYYSYYIVMGLIGLLLCHLKTGKYIPLIFGMVEFALIFIFYIHHKSFTEALVFFLGFIVAVEMLLNMNPIVFTISLVLYEILLLVLYVVKVIQFSDGLNMDVGINLFFLNCIVIYLSFWKRRVVMNRYRTENEIEVEKKKSEELLLNILPENILEELQTNGSAAPESFECVTVLFCEIKNFFELSDSVSPEVLVEELNKLYGAFDSIVEKNECLRIKTFGEIYMAACGLPVTDEKHAQKIICCGKDFLEFTKKRNETSDIKIDVGVGVSSGSVIAGIVGIKKYIYDIFGDTVNTAFRMKTLCEPWQLKVSPYTYELIKEQFEFDPQPPVEVKGKGLMETYNLKVY